MKRRKAIEAITIATGYSIALPSFSSCSSDSYKPIFFSNKDLSLVDEISETILPRTNDVPGAKAANVANFVDTYIHACSTSEQQELISVGLIQLQDDCDDQYNKNFQNITPKQRTTYLTAIDHQASQSTTVHYFSLLKSTILFAYFTSQEGVEKALNYIPVPGKYIGDYPLKTDQKNWAL